MRQAALRFPAANRLRLAGVDSRSAQRRSKRSNDSLSGSRARQLWHVSQPIPRCHHRNDTGAVSNRWSGQDRLADSYDGEVNAVVASSDDRLLVIATSDGLIQWRRASDGVELLSLFPIRDCCWIVWTPEGEILNASAGAEDGRVGCVAWPGACVGDIHARAIPLFGTTCLTLSTGCWRPWIQVRRSMAGPSVRPVQMPTVTSSAIRIQPGHHRQRSCESSRSHRQTGCRRR